jgi:PPE-repeat protein
MAAPMDFSMVPPEINSGLMYAGPGSAPTLAVAGAWDRLAAELRSAATSYENVLNNLSGEWQGPSADAMAAAAQPQLQWMNTAAAQAEQTAAQATAWAAAYDAAFSATVPPPLISANRTQLASLVATNIFGQNTSAIMTTEAQYEQMWAQDSAAMNGYAGSASAAATLTPFNAPGSTTNPAGSPGQNATAAKAAASQAGTKTGSTSSGLTSSTGTGNGTGTGSGSGTGTGTGTGSSNWLNDFLNSQFANTASQGAENGLTAAANSGSFFASLGQIAQGASQAASAAGGAAAGAAGAAGQAAAGGLGGLGTVTANLGRAASLGPMSVPSSWAVNPAATPFEPPLGLTPMKTPNAYAEGMPGMPLPGSTPFRGPGRPEPDYGIRRLRFMARPPAAG